MEAKSKRQISAYLLRRLSRVDKLTNGIFVTQNDTLHSTRLDTWDCCDYNTIIRRAGVSAIAFIRFSIMKTRYTRCGKREEAGVPPILMQMGSKSVHVEWRGRSGGNVIKTCKHSTPLQKRVIFKTVPLASNTWTDGERIRYCKEWDNYIWTEIWSLIQCSIVPELVWQLGELNHTELPRAVIYIWVVQYCGTVLWTARERLMIRSRGIKWFFMRWSGQVLLGKSK